MIKEWLYQRIHGNILCLFVLVYQDAFNFYYFFIFFWFNQHKINRKFIQNSVQANSEKNFWGTNREQKLKKIFDFKN